MEKQSSFRGRDIDQDFVTKFKSSGFYKEIYLKHKDEIIIGALNLNQVDFIKKFI